MDKEELDKLIETVSQINIKIDTLNAINKIEAQFKAYIEIVEPVEECRAGSPDKLWNIVTRLKQQDGEEWAVGEMLERALNMLNALDYENG
jgi:predicted metal-binding protein